MALSVQTIQKHMVARQQTQLKDYLNDQQDPTFVVADKDGGEELQLANKRAESLFSNLGNYGVNLKTRIFMPVSESESEPIMD